MKRKEAAFKNMLKQATPPLEPENTWEGVRALSSQGKHSFSSIISLQASLLQSSFVFWSPGQRQIPERIGLRRRDSGVREEEDIQRLHACLRGACVWRVEYVELCDRR